MSYNSFGHLYRVTTWGESHGPALGCVVDGCPPGIPLTEADIQPWLEARRPGQNKYTTQRQDITGLELSDMGGGTTRIVAAVGVRGFATTVQYDLNQNGANGLYSANMPGSGCPSFSSIASSFSASMPPRSSMILFASSVSLSMSTSRSSVAAMARGDPTSGR